LIQNATVKKIIDEKTAEIEVERVSACGETCAACGGCDTNRLVTARALNTVGARSGDKVIIQSKSSHILGGAALVYIFPLAALLAGFFLASLLGLKDTPAITVSVICLAAASLAVSLSQRRKKTRAVIFEITDIES
jgi:sigma-E factor negative regulatory protein RseC